MPQSNDHVALVGAPPSPHTMAFLRWVDNYVEKRKAQCVFKRSTTYYIDPVSGNDGANDGLSSASPWKSLDPVRDAIAAGASDTAFLFKRGTVLEDATGLSPSSSNTRLFFGAYGDIPSSGWSKPVLSHFLMKINSGGLAWTNGTGDRWTIPVASFSANPTSATAVGWLREADQEQWLNPYTYVDSTAKVESTPYSFYFTGSTLHLNPGSGIDPNTVNYEATPDKTAMPDGILLGNGVTQTWIDGLIFTGWGCSSQGILQSHYGVKSFLIDDDVAYLSNCEEYYAGRHQLGSHETGGTGGYLIVESCVVGYANAINGGSTTLNSYSGGDHEHVLKNCVVAFAPLPYSIAGNSNFTPQAGEAGVGGAFFGHTGSGSVHGCNLYLNIECSVIDMRGKYPRATANILDLSFSDNVTSTATDFFKSYGPDPADRRHYVIGMKPCRIRSTTPDDGGSLRRFDFINCHFYVFNQGPTGAPKYVWADKGVWGAYFQNCIFEIDDETGVYAQLFPSAIAPDYSPRFMNCLFWVRGAYNSGHLLVNYTNGTGYGFANSLFICLDNVLSDNGRELRLNRLGNGTTYTTPVKNDTDHLRYIAIAGCLASDTGSGPADFHGFDQAVGFVNITSFDPGIMPMANFSSGEHPWTGYGGLPDNSALAAAGHKDPFAGVDHWIPAPEYDFLGRRRPSTPSIGPIDLIAFTTGTDATRNNSRDPVRSPVS